LAESATVETRFASPLTLLTEEEQRGDRQAEDALFLSFTADLGFFEAFILGVTQACGARVTVVGDADVASADPRAVRRAGRSYLPGLAVCGGAFHPKVIALVGPTRATVAVGSGNATLAGWQANAELWTVLRGDMARCPVVMSDVVRWLRGLPDVVTFSVGVAEALQRVAASIDDLVSTTGEQSNPGVRLVTSADGPILEQLPDGPVDELSVCAPFHDPGATALRALVDRLRPTRLLVSYQPDLTTLDAAGLVAIAAHQETEIRIDGETRFRHGKLVEWVQEGQRLALTGSPNLTNAALLRSLSGGGNCEVGIVTPVTASLLPIGATIPLTKVTNVRPPATIREPAGPRLLGASRAEQGLHVLLARALRDDGYLELSPAVAPPESWERVGEVPAGTVEIMVTVAADGGSRLRVVVPTSDGAPIHSNIVFVVDPARASRRPGITKEDRPTTRPFELFDDPKLAERFFSDLTTLKPGLPAPPPRVAARSAPAGEVHAGVRGHDGWEHYLDDCAGRIGQPLLRFALGLPDLPDHTEAETIRPSWDELAADDAEAGLEDDDAETAANERPTDPPPVVRALPDLRRTEAVERRRYQTWAARLCQAAPQLGAPERMLVVRLLLWTAAAGAWNRDDTIWVGLVADSLCSLGQADLPTEIEPQVGSLAATALSVIRAQAPRYAHTEATLAYERAVDAVAHLLPATERTYVDEYRQLLDEAFGLAVDPDNVQDLAEAIVQGDPIADAVEALAERGHDAHRHGSDVLHVAGRYGNLLLVALEAVGAADSAPLVGAWATSSDGNWALCAWRSPDLITIDKHGPRPLWRHYRLTGLITPRGLALEKSFAAATGIRHVPFVKPFPEAIEILEELGISQPPTPPRDCSS
jgi:hypothetical protein